MGADFAYMGSPFTATDEAYAEPGYKQMIVDSGAGRIVYSDYFTGVHGNYLRRSIEAAGLDPDKLPSDADMDSARLLMVARKPSAMCGALGQGIGAIQKIQPAASFIEQLKKEYQAAIASFCS